MQISSDILKEPPIVEEMHAEIQYHDIDNLQLNTFF